MLNDARIRRALKEYLLAKSKKPKMLIDELRIHNGNSIADIVAVYDFLHGYEIKGENDNVLRLRTQSEFYSASFPSVTLVTTKNHVAWAEQNLPEFWGILLASDKFSHVRFSYIRPTKHNPKFSKETSLSILWKDELINIALERCSGSLRKSDSRSVLVDKIHPLLKRSEAARLVSSAVLNRRL